MGNLSQLQQIGLGFTGIGLAGSAVSGLGQYESGQQQKAAYDYDAAITLQQMQDKEQTTEASYDNLIGKQATSFARAGVDIASGSPLLMALHTASQKGVEEESENQAGTEQAKLDRYYGSIAAFQGTVAGIDTFLTGMAKAGTSTAQILGT